MTSPGGGVAAAFARRKAASIIATPPFMSSVPRPQTKPSSISPPNGGCVHSPSAGTTSTWPVQQQRRRGAGAGEAGDQARPLGVADELDRALGPGRVPDQLLDPGDALALVPGRVRGVEAEQFLQDLHGLIAGHRRQSPQSRPPAARSRAPALPRAPVPSSRPAQTTSRPTSRLAAT